MMKYRTKLNENAYVAEDVGSVKFYSRKILNHILAISASSRDGNSVYAAGA